jgi:hypothetical protein
MRVVVITKDNMDYSRAVQTFLDDFARRTGKTLEVMDPVSRDGESLCRAYDIVEYPTILALGDDGQMQNMWRGTSLPTINEVSYYVSSY